MKTFRWTSDLLQIVFIFSECVDNLQIEVHGYEKSEKRGMIMDYDSWPWTRTFRKTVAWTRTWSRRVPVSPELCFRFIFFCSKHFSFFFCFKNFFRSLSNRNWVKNTCIFMESQVHKDPASMGSGHSEHLLSVIIFQNFNLFFLPPPSSESTPRSWHHRLPDHEFSALFI